MRTVSLIAGITLALALPPGQPAAAEAPAPLPLSVTSHKDTDGTRRIEVILEGELSRRLARADRWDIVVTASPEERKAGRLPKIDVHAWNLRLPKKQVLAEVELTAENVEVDLRREVLTAAGQVRLLTRLRPEDLARFIEAKAGGKVRNVHFALRGDQVDEHFTVRAGPLWLRVHRLGMSHVNGNAVYTRARRLSVAGLPVPRFLLRGVERRINPIFDANELNVPVRLEEVRVSEGLLEARIGLDLADLPEARLPELVDPPRPESP